MDLFSLVSQWYLIYFIKVINYSKKRSDVISRLNGTYNLEDKKKALRMKIMKRDGKNIL